MERLKQLIKKLDEQMSVSLCSLILIIIFLIWLLNNQTITTETIIDIIKIQ